MAKSNYQYQKFQKDLAKKKKQEEKLRRRLAKKNLKARENADQSSEKRDII